MTDDEDGRRDDAEDGLDGIDEQASSEGFGEYPLDSLMIRNETRTVHDVLRRIEKDQFILDPDFQRAFVWDERRQSRLIESVLLRIPLPVMYLAENPDGRLVVVDGLQRLTTFQRFVSNKLGLDLDHPDLRAKRFKELEMRLQNRIEDTQLILYIIDAKVPERVRLDIFERVNGGVPLTRQQMRNCLYNGPGTRWLRERVASAQFKDLFSPKSLRDMQLSMRDRELVNRFAAFSLFGWESYRGDMDQFLGDALKRLNNEFSDPERERLTLGFERGIANNIALFDRMAFRRHTEGMTKGSRFNVALFDVFCTGLGRYEPERIEAASDALRRAFFMLMVDGDFVKAIASGTNQTDRVRARFNLVADGLKVVLGDP